MLQLSGNQADILLGDRISHVGNRPQPAGVLFHCQ